MLPVLLDDISADINISTISYFFYNFVDGIIHSFKKMW